MKDLLKKVGDENTCPVAVLMREGKILTGLRNYTKDKWKDVSVWTIPGGRCDAGETIEQALRREVVEEVGIVDFQIERFIGEVSGVKEGDTVPIFFCTTTQDATLMEPEKFSEWRWITVQEYLEGEHTGFNPPVREAIVEYFLNLEQG